MASLFLLSNSSYAQESSWYAKTNLGVSTFTKSQFALSSTGRPFAKTIHFDLSWSYGGGYRFKTSKNTFLRIGFMFNKLGVKEEKEKLINYLPNPAISQLISQVDAKITEQVKSYYFSIPVSYTLHNQKIGFTLGTQILYLLKSKSYTSIVDIGPNKTIDNNQVLELNTLKFDIGIDFGFIYMFDNYFSLELNIFQGLRSIFKNEEIFNTGQSFSYRSDYRNQQISLGISYCL